MNNQTMTTITVTTTSAAQAARPVPVAITLQESPIALPEGRDRLTHPVWLRAMYIDAHCSVNKIGAVVGATDAEVTSALRGAGLTLREPGPTRWPQLTDPEFMVNALVARKMFLREVARELGCSEQTVGKATRHPEVAAALAAAGWTNGWPTSRVNPGQSRRVLPADQNFLTALGAAGPDFMTRDQVADALGITGNNNAGVGRVLEKLATKGLVERTQLRRGGRGRPPWAYRLVAQ
jgi:hypothetical protein